MKRLLKKQGTFKPHFKTCRCCGTLASWVFNVECEIADTKSPKLYYRQRHLLTVVLSRPGIVTGLVAYSSGGNGSILFIEVADMPGSGSVQLTGKLGDVLKESVEVALSWVKAHAYELGLTHDPTENIMKNRSIHVHCPSGAIPKVCITSQRKKIDCFFSPFG